MSGFTGAGHPKAVPAALADRIDAAHTAGEDFRINLLTGASTGEEVDGALARVNGIAKRAPFVSDPDLRKQINAGEVEYTDTHLSHLAQQVWFGFHGNLDVAVIEVAAILPNGLLVPGSSVGNNKTWLDLADKVILEVNEWHPREYEGFHDVYYGTKLPPHRRPIEILDPLQRIGDPYLRVDPDKVVAVVHTNAPDRDNTFAAPDDASEAMADHLIDFLRHEVSAGRMPKSLLPLQSGVGNVANAVLRRPCGLRVRTPHLLHGSHPGQPAAAPGLREARRSPPRRSPSPARWRRSSTGTSSPTRAASSCAPRRCRTTRRSSAAWASSRSTGWWRRTSTAT